MGQFDQPTRRSVLKGLGLGGLAVASGGFLCSCGTKGANKSATGCTSIDKSRTEKKIVFSNWPEYIDPSKGKGTSTLEKFHQQTRISVDYSQDVNDNASFYAKVSDQLLSCKSCGRDVFVLTDWMAAKMIRFGWIQTLDKTKLPNVEANLLDSLRSPGWDPKRDHAVPWQSGMTGICYNADLTKPVGSFSELLTRPDLKGKVDLLSEMRDTMLFMLLIQGDDPASFTDAQYGSAIDALQKIVSDGQIRRFTGNDYLEDLKGGNVVACEAWSGDIPQLGDPKFKWIAPEEGVSLWSDNMLVPNKATHKSNVEELMNFYYEPKVAAQLAAWNYYFCPVKGAEDYIGEFDKSAVGNPLIFPSEKILSHGKAMMALDDKQDQGYERMFSQVMGG